MHHNTFLSLLTETGLVGLGLDAGRFGPLGPDALAAGPRQRTCPTGPAPKAALTVGALGLYVCQALFHELSYLPMDNALLFFLAGITDRTLSREVQNVNPKRGSSHADCHVAMRTDIDDCGVPLALPVPRCVHWLTAACRWLCPCSPPRATGLCRCGGRCR